jgi:hypothetical protein
MTQFYTLEIAFSLISSFGQIIVNGQGVDERPGSSASMESQGHEGVAKALLARSAALLESSSDDDDDDDHHHHDDDDDDVDDGRPGSTVLRQARASSSGEQGGKEPDGAQTTRSTTRTPPATKSRRRGHHSAVKNGNSNVHGHAMMIQESYCHNFGGEHRELQHRPGRRGVQQESQRRVKTAQSPATLEDIYGHEVDHHDRSRRKTLRNGKETAGGERIPTQSRAQMLMEKSLSLLDSGSSDNSGSSSSNTSFGRPVGGALRKARKDASAPPPAVPCPSSSVRSAGHTVKPQARRRRRQAAPRPGSLGQTLAKSVDMLQSYQGCADEGGETPCLPDDAMASSSASMLLQNSVAMLDSGGEGEEDEHDLALFKWNRPPQQSAKLLLERSLALLESEGEDSDFEESGGAPAAARLDQCTLPPSSPPPSAGGDPYAGSLLISDLNTALEDLDAIYRTEECCAAIRRRLILELQRLHEEEHRLAAAAGAEVAPRLVVPPLSPPASPRTVVLQPIRLPAGRMRPGAPEGQALGTCTNSDISELQALLLEGLSDSDEGDDRD